MEADHPRMTEDQNANDMFRFGMPKVKICF